MPKTLLNYFVDTNDFIISIPLISIMILYIYIISIPLISIIIPPIMIL